MDKHLKFDSAGRIVERDPTQSGQDGIYYFGALLFPEWYQRTKQVKHEVRGGPFEKKVMCAFGAKQLPTVEIKASECTEKGAKPRDIAKRLYKAMRPEIDAWAVHSNKNTEQQKTVCKIIYLGFSND